jgi:hypothetical protein
MPDAFAGNPRWLLGGAKGRKRCRAPPRRAAARRCESLLRDKYPANAHGPFRHTLVRYITGDGPLAPGRVEATYRQLVGKPQAWE